MSFTSCGLKIGSMHLNTILFYSTCSHRVLNSIQGISGEENKIYPSTTCLYLHVVDGIIQIETTLIHFYFLLHILNNLFLAVHTQLLNVIYLFIITAPAINTCSCDLVYHHFDVSTKDHCLLLLPVGAVLRQKWSPVPRDGSGISRHCEAKDPAAIPGYTVFR